MNLEDGITSGVSSDSNDGSHAGSQTANLPSVKAVLLDLVDSIADEGCRNQGDGTAEQTASVVTVLLDPSLDENGRSGIQGEVEGDVGKESADRMTDVLSQAVFGVAIAALQSQEEGSNALVVVLLDLDAGLTTGSVPLNGNVTQGSGLNTDLILEDAARDQQASLGTDVSSNIRRVSENGPVDGRSGLLGKIGEVIERAPNNFVLSPGSVDGSQTNSMGLQGSQIADEVVKLGLSDDDAMASSGFVGYRDDATGKGVETDLGSSGCSRQVREFRIADVQLATGPAEGLIVNRRAGGIVSNGHSIKEEVAVMTILSVNGRRLDQ